MEAAAHMRPACVRRSPGKEDGCSLKPFVAIQRVQLPPGKGAARQPEASLAWAAATTLVKRRQRRPKPGVEPRYHVTLEPSVCWTRGQHRQDRHGEVLLVRPGSESRAKDWDGTPGNRS